MRKVVVMIVISSLLATGCSQKTTDKSFSIVGNDVSTVTLNTQINFPEMRVVAVANGSAEIVSALGLKQILVGRDIASTDEDLKEIPVVTSGHQLIPEKVISLNPEVILIDSSSGPASAIKAIQNAGIKAIDIPESWTLADISIKVRAVAIALGAPELGDQLMKKMDAKIAALPLQGKKRPTIAFLYLRGTSSIYLIGGKGSGADSVIEAAGGRDIGAANLSRPFQALTSEVLVNLDPDIFLVMTKGLESVGGIDGLVALPGVAQTSAGINRRVITVDDSLLLSFGPRTPSLITKMNGLIGSEVATI